MNNDISNSFKEYLNQKLSTPIYGTFFISWLIIHWEFVYTMFFVSEHKIWLKNGLLRNEYLKKLLFNNSSFWSTLFSLFEWIVPFLITYLIIWIFPKYITIPAFKKSEAYKTEKKKIKLKNKRKLESDKKLLEEAEAEKLEAMSMKAEKEKEIEEKDPSIKWEQEYKNFVKIKYYDQFDLLMQSIYQYGGRVSWFKNIPGTNRSKKFSIPKDFLAYLHANDLIEFNDNKESFNLTSKGKFFVKMYTSDEKNKSLDKDNLTSDRKNILTKSQIDSIISLLQSFGADKETIINVKKALVNKNK